MSVDVLYACLYQPALCRVEGPGGDRPGDGPLAAIAHDFSPRFEVHRDDLIVIDVSGLRRLLGPPREVGVELQQAAVQRGHRVHVAVAGTWTAAHLLARSRPGLTVVPRGTEADALASIPIGILEHSVGSALNDSAISALKRWGIKTLGALAALPAADLSARLGPAGLRWQALARGADTRPLVPTLDAERFESSLELEWPIEGLEPLSFVLTRLLEPLSTRLERRDRGAAVLHVVLRLVNKEDVIRSLQLPVPLRDVRTLRTLALLDLESHLPGAAVDRVQVVIDPTPARVLQHTLFSRAQPTVEQLSTLLARLTALMGSDRVGAAATVDSYRPGAFQMKPFRTEHREPRASGEPREPRPPTVGAALRRCRQSVPARVTLAGGRPVRITTDRRGFAGGTVRQCAGPWRTSGEWWAGEAGKAGGAGAWNRDEWDVALGDGAVYRIFRDDASDGWFIDAIVD